jgi:hypothetical protein
MNLITNVSWKLVLGNKFIFPSIFVLSTRIGDINRRG